MTSANTPVDPPTNRATSATMVGATTETAPASAGNTPGSLTTPTDTESKMAGSQFTRSTAVAVDA